MRKVIAMILVLAVVVIMCVGCGNRITGQGFTLIDDDGTFVTFQLKCTHCGQKYTTNHQIVLYEGRPYEAYVTCDFCFREIHVSMTRN